MTEQLAIEAAIKANRVPGVKGETVRDPLRDRIAAVRVSAKRPTGTVSVDVPATGGRVRVAEVRDAIRHVAGATAALTYGKAA